jgi:hypothetical protein
VRTKRLPARIPGTTYVNIELPEALHETMKTLRLIHCALKLTDVKQKHLYREAVEQYVNAKPQQQLLKEHRNGAPKTSKAGGDRHAREAARV